jgi:ABC-type transport system substrate-binding protein
MKLKATGALVFAVIVAACSTPPPLEPTRLPDQPTRGGVYRIVGPYDVITLDPARANGVEDVWATTLLFNRLFAFDATGTLQPDLAQALPAVNADSTIFTITLRSGVKFHSGRVLTADDVVFSLERVLRPETASWGAGVLWHVAGSQAFVDGAAPTVAGLHAADANTVVITLDRSSSGFPASLSSTALAIVPRDATRSAGDKWGAEIASGSGPFRLAEWKPGELLRFTRFDSYFRAPAPNLEQIILTLNAVSVVAMERWDKGEAEFAWFSDGTDEQQRMKDNAALKSVTGPSIGRLTFNVRHPLLRDLRVRQAIVLALDTQAIASALPAALPLTSRERDLARARALLAEAGVSGERTNLVLLAVPIGSEIDVLRAALGEIGIDTTLMNGDEYALAEQKAINDVALVYRYERRATPDWLAVYADLLHACADEPDASHLPCNPDLTAQVEAAEREPWGSDARAAAYAAAAQRVTGDLPWIDLVQLEVSGLSRPTVRGDALHPQTGLPDLESAWMVRP